MGNIHFMRSEATGQSNAVWFTLIAPWKHLIWIFGALPKLKVRADTIANHNPLAYSEKIRPRQRARKTA